MTPPQMPPSRIAGIGFRETAQVESILDALERAGAADLRHIALPAVKARHHAARQLSRLGYHLHPVTAAALTAPATLTDSAASRAAHGTGSVSEACALAALGPGACLTAPRVISADGKATAAIAQKDLPPPKDPQQGAAP
ncbi:cobalamin biosynthesis protein [Pseudomonas sp. GX19020]|uniref:cobalamin biosynthesis protein n=1 Tax=Pseudomonas sp. GX19020 TaxID=2942277 RepID=UPI002018FFBC|nr:cobalamin biosynthesis protein [Pseudomonas sp. GX19020]MCL4066280.1 cobalamin biosynthesis protein [Pseudomonas sp. GX19020]